MDKTRTEIVEEARRIRQESMAIIADIERWNRANPDQGPIDPDPEGVLGRMIASTSRLLMREDSRPGDEIPEIGPADVLPKEL